MDRAALAGLPRRLEHEVGIGIAEADLPYIFDRFYRRLDGGLGIGLAIAKELVEAHGGRITAESAPGRGAKFTIWLPE